MARDLDTGLLESVAVRRQRLRDAFVHGSLRTRRSMNDNVRRLFLSVVVAALSCAGCAATSFVRAHLGSANSSLAPISVPAGRVPGMVATRTPTQL